MLDVTLWGAFLAGLLSFVSPCVLPLVPPYLCFLAGVTLDELTAQGKPAGVGAAVAEGAEVERPGRLGVQRRVLLSSFAFVLGFSTVFTALGASASAVGRLLLAHSQTLAMVAGVAIIVMGLHFLGALRIPFLYREARVEVSRRPAGPLGAYAVGLAFGFGWTPCIGPVLAAILAVAGTRASVGEGALLLAVYSAGIGLPFLLAALFAGPFMRLMMRFRRHMGAVEKTMGVLLVLTGIAFLTGWMATASYWLLETFPSLAAFG